MILTVFESSAPSISRDSPAMPSTARSDWRGVTARPFASCTCCRLRASFPRFLTAPKVRDRRTQALDRATDGAGRDSAPSRH